VKIKSFHQNPRVLSLHKNMVAPDAKRARAAGLVDKGAQRAATDGAFGLTSTEALRGIGSSTARKLQTIGIMTISQLAHSVSSLATLGPQAASVIAVRAALQETLTGKERARRDGLTQLRAIGDLPRRPVAEYQSAARAWLMDRPASANTRGLDDDALAQAIDAALLNPAVTRRAYLPDLETPVRAWVAEFDISAFSDDSRLRCVHEGDQKFATWTTA